MLNASPNRSTADVLFFASSGAFDLTICGLTFYGAYKVSLDESNGSNVWSELLKILVRDGMHALIAPQRKLRES